MRSINRERESNEKANQRNERRKEMKIIQEKKKTFAFLFLSSKNVQSRRRKENRNPNEKGERKKKEKEIFKQKKTEQMRKKRRIEFDFNCGL